MDDIIKMRLNLRRTFICNKVKIVTEISISNQNKEVTGITSAKVMGTESGF